VEYRLSVTPADFEYPLQLLGFGPATADEVRVDDRETVVLWPATGALRVATVGRSESVDRSSDRIVLEYRVPDAIEEEDGAFVVRLPVAVVTLPGREGVDDLFRASVLLPQDWRVADGFPSGTRLGEDGAYVATLSVVPSVIRLQGRSDGAWRPGLPFLVDLLIVTILAAFAYRGWRHLRRIAG
jgi:hypothetical protein